VGLERGRLAWGVAWVTARHERFTRFDRDSELSRFNAAGGSGWVPVSAELEGLLRVALWAYDVSGGLVHAGVLGSMLAIGYTRSLHKGPTPAALDVCPPPPLTELLQVQKGRARLRTGAGIDPGGIAKGWLADRLAAELGANCLVNLGGDLFARGRGLTGQGWPVGLPSPGAGFGETSAAGSTVLLRDQGAATSGTRRRAWRHGDRDLHHLIDPRTGQPSASDLAEVTVVAASAAEAEVHAKVALLVGSEGAPRYLAASALAWSITPGQARRFQERPATLP
jgi:thiamine biosynthesis lipoprotein